MISQNSKEQSYGPGDGNGVGTSHANGDGQHAVGMATNHTEDRNQEEALKALKGDLQFSIEESPPWYMSIMLGFQVIM